MPAVHAETTEVKPRVPVAKIYLLPIATGLMILVASPPYGFSAAAFVGLVPLLHAVRLVAGYRGAALAGYLAGAALFVPGVFWMSNVAWAGYAALALYCASYFLVFALFAYAVRNTTPLWNASLVGAFWLLLEIVRGRLITGFPWLLLSHTQYDFTTFTQILDVTGAYGLSAIMAMLNVLLYRGALNRDRRPLFVAAGIFVAIAVYGIIRTQTIEIRPLIRVASVQASVPQEMKETLEGKYDPKGVMLRYAGVTESIAANENIDMVVWPETVLLFPYTLNVNPEVLTPQTGEPAREAQTLLAKLARDRNAYLLAGATSYLPAEYGYVNDAKLARQIPPGAWDKRYNSAYLLDPNGAYQGRYDKIHLVPFGEYIPLPNVFPFLAKLVPFTESLIAGERQTIFTVKGKEREGKFGVLICYEDMDPELARGLRQLGADFLVNISNDAWFGTSIELDQHFAVARFRAIENRTGVVRSGNNGITGLIDPLGRVTALFEKETNGVMLTKDVTGYLAGQVSTSNAFSTYSRFGDLPGMVLAGIVLVAGMRQIRRAS